MSSTRQRWFCCLCGNLTKRELRPDGRALCTAHMTVALDEVPPSELESLPVMGQEIKGLVFDGLAGFDLGDPATRAAIRRIAAQSREDLPPASGTDG